MNRLDFSGHGCPDRFHHTTTSRTMTDGEAILRSVLLAPDDDAPRLIYADWLEEHGEQDRAYLIRRMVAAPTYTFFWTRRLRQQRHIHSEPIRAIRGLKRRLSELTRADWGIGRTLIRSLSVVGSSRGSRSRRRHSWIPWVPCSTLIQFGK